MKCPGQDTRYWKPDAIFEIKCPFCGNEIEFFKDDPQRKCKKCGRIVPNPRLDFGCLKHCPYAKECISQLPEEVRKNYENLLKESLNNST